MYENEVNIIGLKLAKVLLKELERGVTFRFPEGAVPKPRIEMRSPVFPSGRVGTIFNFLYPSCSGC